MKQKILYHTKTPGNPGNILSVRHSDNAIIVNKKLWKTVPLPIKYWLLCWAKYVKENGMHTADRMATMEYVLKKHDSKLLLNWFPKIGGIKKETIDRYKKILPFLKP